MRKGKSRLLVPIIPLFPVKGNYFLFVFKKIRGKFLVEKKRVRTVFLSVFWREDLMYVHYEMVELKGLESFGICLDGGGLTKRKRCFIIKYMLEL